MGDDEHHGMCQCGKCVPSLASLLKRAHEDARGLCFDIAYFGATKRWTISWSTDDFKHGASMRDTPEACLLAMLEGET